MMPEGDSRRRAPVEGVVHSVIWSLAGSSRQIDPEAVKDFLTVPVDRAIGCVRWPRDNRRELARRLINTREDL